MKRAVHLVFLTVLMLCMQTAAPAQTAPGPFISDCKHDPLFDQRTYQKLWDIRVDVPQENNVELNSVLRDLTLVTIRADPSREQIAFRFESSTAPADRLRKISLARGRASIFAVLQSLSQQSFFDIKVHKNLVLILPRPAN